MKHALKYEYRITKTCLHSFFHRILLFKGAGKDTIPIYIPAARPRIGTIGKNHIPSSFIFCIKLFSFSALNLILSLRIIPYPFMFLRVCSPIVYFCSRNFYF